MEGIGMVQAGSLVWMVFGSALISIGLRVAAPPLAWLALISLLHASRSMQGWRAVPWLLLGLYAAVAFGNHGILPMAGPTYFAICGFIALTLAIPFMLERFALPARNGLGSTLIFPMAFVAVEFLRSRFAPGATWGSIAYMQYGWLPLMQTAAFAGIAGITFLMAWFASTFEMAWSRGFDRTIVLAPVLTCVAVLGVVLVGGSVRLALARTGRASLRIAAVNRPPDLFVPGEMTRITEGSVSPVERLYFAGKLAWLHDWFLESSRREAASGARLILWPEQNLLVFKEDEPAFLKQAQQLAAGENIYLAMGMGTIHLGERLPFENKLVLIDPSGSIILSYRKTHPVFGWEAGIMKRGDGRLPVVSTAEGRIAAAICYDADFPEFIRQAGLHSADLLLVPANDWKEIKHVHSGMAAFRAIENGVPLVRAAASGVSGVFDPWGRLLGEADYFAPGDRTLTAQVPLGRIPTLYARTGDLFAWLCVTGLALALGSAAITLRKAAEHSPDGGRPVYSLMSQRRVVSPVCFLYAIGIPAVWLAGGWAVRLAIRDAAEFLNQTVQQQFVRASQIPAGHGAEREARDGSSYAGCVIRPKQEFAIRPQRPGQQQ
jgi:apolipoprotein N-acyltransferase